MVKAVLLILDQRTKIPQTCGVWPHTHTKYLNRYIETEFSSVQSLSCVWLFATTWTGACQASLSNTNSRSLLKLMSIELVIPSNHLVLCRPLFLLPSIFPSIRVFSKELALHIRWTEYWLWVLLLGFTESEVLIQCLRLYYPILHPLATFDC